MKSKKQKEKRLTPRQQRFVELYLGCLNAAKAARDAGFSEKTADKKAFFWVGKSRADCPSEYHHVWEAVQKGLAEKAKESGITVDRFLAELQALAFFDPTDAYAFKTMTVKAMSDIPEALRRCIQSVTPLTKGEYKISFCDKTKALDMIGKYLGAFVTRTELTGPNGGPIKTEASGIDLSKLSTDELLQLRQILAKGKSGPDGAPGSDPA